MQKHRLFLELQGQILLYKFLKKPVDLHLHHHQLSYHQEFLRRHLQLLLNNLL
tara:strand:- start:69 stop:227 length:159 start_codon:yes stop_codon:yes gene_type:complete